MGQVINLIITTLLFFFTSCERGECSQGLQVLQTVGLFVFYCLGTVCYFYFYTVQVEYFPTQIKATALLVTAISARSALVVVPLIQQWFIEIRVNVILSFAISSFLYIVFTLPFPETLGTPPPEMIQELEYKTS